MVQPRKYPILLICIPLTNMSEVYVSFWVSCLHHLRGTPDRVHPDTTREDISNCNKYSYLFQKEYVYTSQ